MDLVIDSEQASSRVVEPVHGLMPADLYPLRDQGTGKPWVRDCAVVGRGYTVLDIRQLDARQSNLDTLTFKLSGQAMNEAILERLKGEVVVRDGSFGKMRCYRIRDPRQDYLDIYQPRPFEDWDVTVYPARYATWMDMELLLALVFPNFSERDAKITCLDFHCDLGLAFSEARRMVTVSGRRKSDFFSNDSNVSSNGIRFGGVHRHLKLYDKSRKCVPAGDETQAEMKCRSWTRVEARFEKTYLPIKRFSECYKLVDFNPFEDVDLNNVFVALDAAWEVGDRVLYDKLAMFNSIRVYASLQHGLTFSNRDRHLNRLLDGAIKIEPLNVDFNAQWRRDFAQFLDFGCSGLAGGAADAVTAWRQGWELTPSAMVQGAA